MQKVFLNDMVCHVWAQQSQPCGYNSSRSYSFDGGVLDSYDTTIALHYGDFVLSAEHSQFSPTTGRHTPSSWDVKPSNIIYLSEFFSWSKRYYSRRDYPKGPAIKKALLAMILDLSKSYAKRKRDTTRAHDAHMIKNRLQDLAFICERFNLAYPAGYTDSTEVLGTTDKVVKRLADQAARAKRKEAKKLEKQRAEDKEQMECWLAGDVIRIPWSYTRLQKWLTVRDDKVITSEGAEAPLEHVRKAFKLYSRVVKSGKTWTKNGERCRLGHFDLDRIDANGNAQAGCHIFTAKELQRFAARWLNV